MPVIAIIIVGLFLVGTAFVKCGRWLKETIELGDKNAE